MGIFNLFQRKKESHGKVELEKQNKENQYIIKEDVDKQFADELINAGLKIYINELYEVAKKSIYLTPSLIEKHLEIGTTKVGGRPDVYDGFEWPTWKGMYLGFLAQINLSEVTHFDHELLLPSHGMLYFFYECEEMAWGGELDDVGSYKVFYYDGDVSKLKRIDFPQALNQEYSIFNEVKLDINNKWSVPEQFNVLLEKDEDTYSEFRWGTDGTQTYLLGYPSCIQNDVREEVVMAKRKINGGNLNWEFSDEELNEWVLLFQLDSMDEANMMWGDCGMLYFMIKKDDLRKRHFDQVQMILQCC